MKPNQVRKARKMKVKKKDAVINMLNVLFLLARYSLIILIYCSGHIKLSWLLFKLSELALPSSGIHAKNDAENVTQSKTSVY